MDQSPLARLRPELRVQIYEYVLQTDGPILIRPMAAMGPQTTRCTWALRFRVISNTSRDNKVPAHILALTNACRQICLEARQVFYATNDWYFQNTLAIHHEDPTIQSTLLSSWMRNLGGAQERSFRHMNIWAYYGGDIVSMQSRLRRKLRPKDLADEIYQQYLQIGPCFDTEKTLLGIEVGGVQPLDARCRLRVSMAPRKEQEMQTEAHSKKLEGRGANAQRLDALTGHREPLWLPSPSLIW